MHPLLLDGHWTQIIQQKQFTCEGARYHVSAVAKMQRRQREDVFPNEHAQSTRSRLPKVGRGEKPLSSYVTLLRQVCSNAVGQASALRLKKQNSGSVAVFARLSGTPARLVFSHHCTHNLATHLGRSCLAKPVLNCAANEVPAVTTGTPCQAMWQPWTDSPNPSSLGSSAQSSTNSIFPAPARD